MWGVRASSWTRGCPRGVHLGPGWAGCRCPLLSLRRLLHQQLQQALCTCHCFSSTGRTEAPVKFAKTTRRPRLVTNSASKGNSTKS